MATFKIKASKYPDQQTITLRQVDSVDVSAETNFSIYYYTDDLDTAVTSRALTNSEVTSLNTLGYIDMATNSVLGDGFEDDFYTLELRGDNFGSNFVGIGITLEAKAKVYGKQGFTAVYSPDFRTDKVRHVAHMLVQEMNEIENQDYTLQKRVDFTTRYAHLREILNF